MKRKSNRILDNLPLSFDVGWAKFKFKIKKNLKAGEDLCYGVTDFNNNEILLEASMDEQITKHTIIHEVCHVLMETFGLGGSEDDGKIESDNEFVTEAVCRSFLFFKDQNPKLWYLLFEETDDE